MTKPIVLAIEDEEDIHNALDVILSKHFEVDHAYTGLEGIKKIIRHTPDLIMLDLRMPEMDGFQLCKTIRSDQEFDNIPIVVVSALNSVADRTKAFELGADDYITKPFDKNELIIRLQRKLEKRASSPDKAVQGVRYELDSASLCLISQGEKIQFSSVEFKIIKILSDNFLNLVSRDNILKEVWEKQEVSPRLIDPHILAIRNKIRAVNLTIQSVYGRGYILKEI